MSDGEEIIANITDFEAWLKTQPIEDSVILEIVAKVKALCDYQNNEHQNVLQGLKAIARIEPMSRLLTLKAFRKEVTKYLETQVRAHWIVFVVIDVADFKVVNTTFGHAGGDAALEAIGKVLGHIRATSGVATRSGGDEFFLFGEVRDREEASGLARRMYQVINDIRLEAYPRMRLIADMGVICVPLPPLSERFSGIIVDAETAEQRMEVQADGLLYAAKYYAKSKEAPTAEQHYSVKEFKFRNLLEKTKKEKEAS